MPPSLPALLDLQCFPLDVAQVLLIWLWKISFLTSIYVWKFVSWELCCGFLWSDDMWPSSRCNSQRCDCFPAVLQALFTRLLLQEPGNFLISMTSCSTVNLSADRDAGEKNAIPYLFACYQRAKEEVSVLPPGVHVDAVIDRIFFAVS